MAFVGWRNWLAQPAWSAYLHQSSRPLASLAFILPMLALYEAAVWLLGPDGMASRRDIRLGVSGTESVQVLDGLQPGDRIVVKGVDKVHGGDTLP